MAVCLVPGMTPYHWSLSVWLSWFVIFVVLELLAAFDKTPWNTLSWTAWQLQSRSSIFSLAFAAGMGILLIHILFRWPNKSRFQPPQGPEGRNLPPPDDDLGP